MQLSEYLKSTGISVAEFGLQIGAKSRANVYRYLKGVHIPEPKVMKKIVVATQGKVTANDFYNVISKPKKHRPN